MTFRGDVPMVPCRRLSGADCDEIISADVETCPAGHPIPTRDLSPPPEGVSGETGPSRPRMIGNDRVEYVTVEGTDAVLARLVSGVDDLRISRRACDQMAEHHGIDADHARAELRLLVTTAAAAGALSALPSGYWRMDHARFTVHLDPSGSVIVSYATRHYERTPSEVFAGAKSRFGRSSRQGGYRPTGPRLSLDQLRHQLHSQPGISERLVDSWAKRTQQSAVDAEAELIGRLLADAAQGRWNEDEKGWVLVAETSTWRIAPDAPVALAVWPTQPAATS